LVVTEYEKLLANVLTLLFQPKENIGEKP